MPICLKCQVVFPNWVKINNENKNLSSRKFCLTCSPFGQKNRKDLTKIEESGYRTCKCCRTKLELNDSNFYKRKTGGFHYRCKSCLNTGTKIAQQTNKIKAIQYKGGKCVSCGYSKCLAALEFHHINPAAKDFSLASHKTYNFEKLKKELDKCVLLCCLCHREFHAGLLPAKW